jgi:hypothetical protein
MFIGISLIEDNAISISAAIDKALFALSALKPTFLTLKTAFDG